jgi:hypothetical protein
MNKRNFSAYWAQVENCNFKAGLVELPASRQLWIDLAQDWAALAQSQTLPKRERSLLPRKENREQFLAA